MKIQSSFISCTDFKNNLFNANYISSHVFYYTSHKRNIKGIIWDSYIPLSAYVKIDSSLVVLERICAINAALAVSFFTFTFSIVNWLTFTVLRKELLDPSPYYQLFIGHIFFRFLIFIFQC